MKKLIAILLLLVFIPAMTMCTPKDETAVNIGTLKGPTGLGMSALMGDKPAQKISGNYNFTIAASPDELTGKIISGEIDIAAVPTNLAAVLYAKTEGKVRLAAINTLGVLYIVDTTGEINAVSDLAGKTLYATGKGSNPEYILNYILTQNGLNPQEDVEIIYKSEHAELAALLASGEVGIGLLPEPNVTNVLTKNTSAKAAVDMTAEWNEVASDGSVLSMGGLIVSTKFLENHKTLFDKFLSDYEKSVAYIKDDAKRAGELSEKFDIMPAAAAQNALPRCNLTFVTGTQMKSDIEGYYKILYASDPKSVGGSLPDEAFYYTK